MQPTLAAFKGVKDSLALRQQAIAFIKKVKGYALQTAKFRLESQPASLTQEDCLQAVLADNSFTAAEHQAIRLAVTRKVTRWSTADFATARILRTDTIKLILKDWHRGWPYFHEHIGEDFNTFSFPLFIRNNTYCLFYEANYCGGLCAEGNLILYKKAGTNWLEVKRYCSWES
jgi:hypothetical protein